MMLIIFILFTVMHVSDTLYGPRLLISHVGGSVTIKCYYVTTSVNRHDRKFFCKELPHKRCQTVISSNAFIHQDYKERVSMYNNPQKGILQVTMRQLTSRDSSNYRCGIGKTSDGLYARMNLTILEESVFSNILSDAQTTSESLTVNASSYWLMTSKDEVYEESSSYSEQNLLAIVIPVPVLLLLFAVTVILILVKIRRRKTASHNIISKSPEGELPLPTQKCLEEHPQNDNRNSADEDESPLNSDEAEASITVYCLVSHEPDPEDSSKND
ncbi:high affinity immunoglobulin alpha and immunoglobulin mu Fc receptor isoform 3-T3 [Liasis olivaceus]